MDCRNNTNKRCKRGSHGNVRSSFACTYILSNGAAYKQEMVAHTEKFRLFADIEMIAQVLAICVIVKAVDQILQQFAGTVGGNLVADSDSGFAQKRSAVIDGMEDKGEIIQPEGFFIIVAMDQIVFLTLLHGKDDDVIGDKSKENLALGFAHPLCFLNAA